MHALHLRREPIGGQNRECTAETRAMSVTDASFAAFDLAAIRSSIRVIVSVEKSGSLKSGQEKARPWRRSRSAK
jgi:hypothetical protein